LYGRQLEGAGAAQLPRPSQKLLVMSVLPVQVGAAHTVEVPGSAAQLPRVVPSQVAWHAPVPLQLARGATGWVPEGTGVHVPLWPVSVQASHAPVQALSQQTPSAQWPEPHSPSVEHVVASGFEQVPRPSALQASPAAQLELTQQTPSTQLPLEHCVPTEQAVPFAPLVTQVELTVSQL
jgi:hypothetical protein